MAPIKVAERRKPGLRDAQKAFTRQRILDAARDLFYRNGYYATTVDQIVASASASRPTFYLHFTDKDEILGELVAAYSARAVEYMKRLPGPLPTLEEVRAWLVELAAFVSQQKAAISLLADISAHAATTPSYVTATRDTLIAALSHRSPAFAAIVRNDVAGMEMRARAELLLVQITWATTPAWKESGAYGQLAVTIVAEALHAFLHDPRFRTSDGTSRKITKRRKTHQGMGGET
jgi:AcrR family transcriptional regulator